MLLAAGQNGKSIELEPLLAKGYQLILLVPAMNEEGIIEQTMRLFLRETANLPNVKMVIIDDASSDDTALLVKSFSKQAGGKIQLLQRQLPQAQTGKGTALNWAYQQVILESRDPGSFDLRRFGRGCLHGGRKLPEGYPVFCPG